MQKETITTKPTVAEMIEHVDGAISDHLAATIASQAPDATEDEELVREYLKMLPKNDPFCILDAFNRLMRHQKDDAGLREAEPDWWYCDIDPDESGDSAYEAMYNNRERLEPVKLHSSYIGPTKWGVMHDSAEDDGEAATTFDTQEEAQKFCDELKAALSRTGGVE